MPPWRNAPLLCPTRSLSLFPLSLSLRAFENPIAALQPFIYRIVSPLLLTKEHTEKERKREREKKHRAFLPFFFFSGAFGRQRSTAERANRSAVRLYSHSIALKPSPQRERERERSEGRKRKRRKSRIPPQRRFWCLAPPVPVLPPLLCAPPLCGLPRHSRVCVFCVCACVCVCVS